jgi:hypothetical protein
MRWYIGRRINAQLTDGSTLHGMVSRAGRRELELRQAAAVTPQGRTPIDGTVIIPRASLLWMQVV